VGVGGVEVSVSVWGWGGHFFLGGVGVMFVCGVCVVGGQMGFLGGQPCVVWSMGV
jgi:hypothetical protein